MGATGVNLAAPTFFGYVWFTEPKQMMKMANVNKRFHLFLERFLNWALLV